LAGSGNHGLVGVAGRWLLVGIGALFVCAVQAKEPTLADVLGRAGTYVAEFERQLSGIAAEERYVQEVSRFGRGPGRLVVPMQLDLRSELFLVRGGGSGPRWIQFRDVFEADGQPVRDRSERLSSLFADAGASHDDQIRRILDESSRYNLGDVERTINVPLVALQFLESGNQWRFHFKRVAERTPAAKPAGAASSGAAFRVSIEMWTIQYQERETPTIIRTPTGQTIASRGRFWIDPTTGQVLMSELLAESRGVRATIDVSFQSEPLLGMLVPIEMRELYEGRRDGSLMRGHATYGGFRTVTPAERRQLTRLSGR